MAVRPDAGQTDGLPDPRWAETSWRATQRRGSRYRSTVEFVEVDGLRIAYERVGAGHPLVLVHGAAADSRMWRPQLAGLADEFTVVAWDEPGAGRSCDLPEGSTLAGFADALAALIESLQLGPAHLAGLSWGGTVVLELYRRHPQLVATLILIDTYAGWKGSLTAEEVQARAEGARRMLAEPLGEFDGTVPGLFAGHPPADLARLLTAIAGDVRRATLEQEVAIMDRNRPEKPAAWHRRPHAAGVGGLRCSLTADRRPPLRAGHPRRRTRRDRGGRSHEHHGAARAGQCRGPRVLSRPPTPRELTAEPGAEPTTCSRHWPYSRLASRLQSSVSPPGTSSGSPIGRLGTSPPPWTAQRCD